MGDRFLSSAGAGGNCARPLRLPDPSPVLDKKSCAHGSRKFIQHRGWGLETAHMAFPDSSSALDKFQSAISISLNQKFRNGVGGLGGLAPGNPSYATDSGLFSAPFLLSPHEKGATILGALYCCILGSASRQPPPAPSRNF